MRSSMPLFGEATASVSGATQPSKVDSASCSECNASAAYASSGRRIRARLKSRRASVHRPLMQLPFQFGDVGQRRCVLAWLCLVVSQPSAIAVVFVTLPPRSLTNLVGTQIVLPHIGEGGVDFPLVLAQPSCRYGPKNHLKRMRGHQDRNSCNRRGDQKQHRVVYCFSYLMPAPRAPPGPSPKHAL